MNDLPIILLLETSVFDNAQYNFYSGILYSLQKYIERGEIKLWLSNVTVSEAKKHIKNNITTLITNFKNQKELSILKGSDKYKGLFENMDCEEMVISAVNEFELFIKKNNVLILDNDGVLIDEILKDYFEQEPPFCGGKKKAEFPDAIMITKIKKELNNIDELHIVSSDDDWEKSFQNERKVTVYKSIKNFLNNLNKRYNVIFNQVKLFLESKVNEVIVHSEIKKLLDNATFEVDGRVFDRKGYVSGYEYDEVEDQQVIQINTSFNSIELIEKSLTDETQNISEGEIKANISCSSIINLVCRYLNEDESIWDSEEKDYAFRSWGTAYEEHKINFIVSVIIHAKRDSNLELNIIKVFCDEIPTRLDNHTLQGREYESDCYECEYNFRVIKVYKCPKCGTEIEINLINFSEIVSINERQMGVEKEYSIECEGECPNCTKEYKVIGGIWEYPIYALNYDTTKIIW